MSPTQPTASTPARAVSSVTQKLQQFVAPADKAVVLRVNPAFKPVPPCRLRPHHAVTHRLQNPVQCHRLPFSEAVDHPPVHTVILQYPVQTGQELLTLPCCTRKRALYMKPVVSHERTALICQLPMRWSLIRMDQLAETDRHCIARHVSQQLKTDPMASYWQTQGVYGPVYPNKVFKVLRHPTGYLIGLPGQTADASTDMPRAHYVVWLSAGKTKSHLLWVPMEGKA